jgi:hypothetical protein
VLAKIAGSDRSGLLAGVSRQDRRGHNPPGAGISGAASLGQRCATQGSGPTVLSRSKSRPYVSRLAGLRPINVAQPPEFDANLKAMIARSFVGRGLTPTILADVSIHRGEAIIDISLWDEQEDSYTRLWSQRSHKAVRTLHDDLRRQAEVVYQTVVRRVEMVRPKVVGLNLHASVVLSDLLDSTTSSGRRFPSLRSLAPVMCRALARYCSSEWRRHPYDFRLACAFRSSRVDARLEVRKGAKDWRRVRSHPTTRRTVVETAIALLGVDPSWLNGFTKFEVDIDWLNCGTEPSISEPHTADRRSSL